MSRLTSSGCVTSAGWKLSIRTTRSRVAGVTVECSFSDAEMCSRNSSVDQSLVADPTIENGSGSNPASASCATAGMSSRLARSPDSPKRTVRSIIRRHSPELAIEVVGGADQRQVRERLGEVAQLLACRADLLG